MTPLFRACARACAVGTGGDYWQQWRSKYIEWSMAIVHDFSKKDSSNDALNCSEMRSLTNESCCVLHVCALPAFHHFQMPLVFLSDSNSSHFSRDPFVWFRFYFLKKTLLHRQNLGSPMRLTLTARSTTECKDRQSVYSLRLITGSFVLWVERGRINV